MIYTPQNLIENLENIGPWSTYGLASEALLHYFPDYYDENDYCDPLVECKLPEKLGCVTWQDVIIKFQTEIGYKATYFNPKAVNDQ